MVAFVLRMPFGFPGRISRSDSLTVEAYQVDTTTPPTAYGVFVKLVAGKVQPIASGDAATVAFGVLVLGTPSQSTSTGFGPPAPPAAGIVDVMRRGYASVVLKTGTAVQGAPVYVVTTAATGVAIGDIVTSAVPVASAAAVAIPQAFFEGPADSLNNVEISYAI